MHALEHVAYQDYLWDLHPWEVFLPLTSLTSWMKFNMDICFLTIGSFGMNTCRKLL